MEEKFKKGKRSPSKYNQEYRQAEEKSASTLAINKKIRPLPFQKNITLLRIPNSENSVGFSIELGKEKNPYKRLLFSALNAGIYNILHCKNWSDTFAKPCKVLREFWIFVQLDKFTAKSRPNIIKDFETYRVDCNIKIQSSGASFIILLLKQALEFEEFLKLLEHWEFDYIFGLTKTKLAARDHIVPITLNHWFSSHTWLRRDDVGIGNDLYMRLSSPKALTDSFRVTVTTLLLTIQSSKDVIANLFKEVALDTTHIPSLGVSEEFENANAHQEHIMDSIHTFFTTLRDKLRLKESHDETLVLALKLIVYSNVISVYRKGVIDFLLGNKACIGRRIFLTAQRNQHPIFYITFLSTIVQSQKNQLTTMCSSVCPAEQILFAWLMAYQTVQPSDISKLKLSNFKFLERRDGKVQYIECDYFKSRANNYYQVRTLSAYDDLGRSILRYIQDVTEMKNSEICLVPQLPKAFITGTQSIVSRVLLSLEIDSLKSLLMSKLNRERVTSVFFTAFCHLDRNGISKFAQKRLPNSNKIETPIRHTFFGMSSIKTSSVYASSESYDPTKLLNFNSHTDRTEESSYRVCDNEEWNNICGRVTRAVMRDLSINVMRCSKNDRQIFNCEFTRALEFIRLKSNHVLATLKIVTKQDNGKVDELGFLKNPHQYDDALPDAIYLEDSPFTVMKLKHYVSEVEAKHKQLRSCSPEFFFSTVLPTTEWIETILYEDSFCTASLKEGTLLYNQYNDILPPHFTHKLT